MAGIGFELSRLLNKDSFTGLLRAYGLTVVIGSGPGLIILFSLGIVCFFAYFSIPTPLVARQFQAIIIYLFSGSMLVSAFLQYMFTRFVADMEYLKQFNRITPNFMGMLLMQFVGSFCIITPIIIFFFSQYDLMLKVLIISCFCILSLIWIAAAILSETKSYRRIVWGFVLGYSVMLMVHFYFDRKHTDVTFLLLEFFIAQCILLMAMVYTTIALYPTSKLIRFDFLKHHSLHFTLMFANFFYVMGFWIDKYLFWFNPYTGYQVFPPLRLSPVYDVPMFIAMLSMIPGVTIFMLLLESEFALIYPKVMQAIFNQKTLAEIDVICDELVLSGRNTMNRLMKAQAAIIVILLLSSMYIFSTFNILNIHLSLLFVLIISAGLQVVLWALLGLLYYMTKYRHALMITMLFAISNGIFTSISLHMPPRYYGYGVCASLLLTIIVALFLLDKDFKNLEYTTFMMVD